MPPEPITLDQLAAATGGRVIGSGTVAVADVEHDSRRVGPGALFVAVVGMERDGHEYVEEAVGRGAAAVCVERDVSAAVPQLVVPSTRAGLGVLAALVHGDPSRAVPVIGVTGTNGKTTVTHMIEAVANRAGLDCALVGTIGARIGGERIPQARTTPEASDLHRLLARAVRSGAGLAAVEVSSHALRLGRVAGIHFSVAAFTNLGRDHLDFHRDLEDYFAAKRSLFRAEVAERAVVWHDDPYGARIAAEADLPVITVGEDPSSSVRVAGAMSGPDGSRFTLTGPEAEMEIRLRLLGDFNIANAAVAAVCCIVAGIDPDAVAGGLAGLDRIPGRFETVDAGQPFLAVVDYAHTPDAVAKAIAAARRLAAGGRVVAVLGAGGDRDRDKRPEMGGALAGADVAIVTSDNPRHEDPAAIAAALASGLPAGRERLLELDRAAAIDAAVARARPGDVVLVLGKGHEQGQEVGGMIHPFDDLAVLRAALESAGVGR